VAGARLKDVQIKKAKPSDKPYKLFDGGGMFLYVTPGGGKFWRWQFRYQGKYQQMSLGPYPEVTLEKARLKHQAEEKILHGGHNPMEVRKEEKKNRTTPDEANSAMKNFAEIEKEWFDHWKAGKQDRYIIQMEARIARDILPRLGQRPLDEIEAPDIAAMARAIEGRGANELARKALRTTGQIFRFAIAHGFAKRNPVSDIQPSDILKSVEVVNQPRVHQRDLPKLLLDIDSYTGREVTKIAMWVMARTFLRTSELVEAPWAEIDLDAAHWEIPKERMKKPSPHIVPLARQVVKALRKLQKITGNTKWVFPSDWDPSKSMSRGTILGALKRMGYARIMTGHGFRGVASTILHEQGYEEAHIEAQLAHLKRNKVSAAYDYAKYLEPRKKMMQDWADFLEQQPQEAKTSKEGGPSRPRRRMINTAVISKD
jgi:integrase